MSNNYWTEVLKRLELTPEGVWFVYIAGAILIPLSLLVKKHLTWKEWYATYGVIGFLAYIGNIIFFFQLDLLDSGKPAMGSIPDIVMFSLAPSSVCVLYCNFYLSVKTKWGLALGFTVASLITEYILVKIGFLTQKGWNTWYSIPIYLGMYFLFLPWHTRFIKGEK